MDVLIRRERRDHGVPRHRVEDERRAAAGRIQAPVVTLERIVEEPLRHQGLLGGEDAEEPAGLGQVGDQLLRGDPGPGAVARPVAGCELSHWRPQRLSCRVR